MQKLWHTQSGSEVLTAFQSVDTGISDEERAARLVTYGTNTITEEGRSSLFFLFFRQFRSVLIGILLVAAVVSFLVGEVLDTLAILLIVFLNALLGFVRKWRSESMQRRWFREKTFRIREQLGMAVWAGSKKTVIF